MLSRMEHRGPDDQGEVGFSGGWLGHRRLSIVDVDGGHQPLGGAPGERWLVGNGEIYNHEKVRRALGTNHYRTQSDNEVALRLLEQRGPDALGELEGMYALLSATTGPHPPG
jgi:asparagine synthase (glutamine-hydrolysing)